MGRASSSDRIAAIIKLWWLRKLPSDIAKQLGLPEETVGAVSAIVASRLQP